MTMTMPEDAARHFRHVLGQYPTGVTLITAPGIDGDPIGMVVGTFTSVSLEPPLVAFLPARNSSTWPKIREAGSFCANVLTSPQEEVCRAFSQRREDRFSAFEWFPGTGGPRLKGAAAWIDCTIEDVVPGGDHDIVLGRVQDLDVGEAPDLPLLFLRGGYGSFSMRSIQSLDSALNRHLRAVDAARPEVEALAAELGVECVASVAVEDTVIVATAAGLKQSQQRVPSRVGISHPLAAPLASVHVAWAAEPEQRRWLTEGSRLLGSLDAEIEKAELVAVRERGYGVTTGIATLAEWQVAADSASRAGLAHLPDPTGLMRRTLLSHLEAESSELEAARRIVSFQAPVFGPTGQVAIAIDVDFIGDESPERLQHCLDRLLACAGRITNTLGGSAPK